MTTQEVANRLVELCRQGDYETCYMGRQAFDEICVYEVKDGKIMKEEFFYPVQPA